jgi:hypothetical protein
LFVENAMSDQINLFVSYSEKTHIVEDTYGEAGEYTGYTESSTNASVTSVARNKPEHYLYKVATIKDLVKGDTVPEQIHVLVVKYSDGGTFSTTSGCLYIEGLYADYEAAAKVAKSIRDGSYSDYGPWQGYFASLDDLYVQAETIAEHAKITQF